MGADESSCGPRSRRSHSRSGQTEIVGHSDVGAEEGSQRYSAAEEMCQSACGLRRYSPRSPDRSDRSFEVMAQIITSCLGLVLRYNNLGFFSVSQSRNLAISLFLRPLLHPSNAADTCPMNDSESTAETGGHRGGVDECWNHTRHFERGHVRLCFYALEELGLADVGRELYAIPVFATSVNRRNLYVTRGTEARRNWGLV